MRSSGERVRTVRRKLADGTVKEYQYARKAVRTQRVQPGTVNALPAACKLSPEWVALAPATRATYSVYDRDVAELGDTAVASVRRQVHPPAPAEDRRGTGDPRTPETARRTGRTY